MIRDCFDNRIGQAPKTEQVSPGFSVSYTEHLGLDFV